MYILEQARLECSTFFRFRIQGVDIDIIVVPF